MYGAGKSAMPQESALLRCPKTGRRTTTTPRRSEVKGAPTLLDKAYSKIEVNETTMCAITPLSKSMVL